MGIMGSPKVHNLEHKALHCSPAFWGSGSSRLRLMLEINNRISCVMLSEVYIICDDTLPCLSGLNSCLDTLLSSYLSGYVEHSFQPLPTLDFRCILPLYLPHLLSARVRSPALTYSPPAHFLNNWALKGNYITGYSNTMEISRAIWLAAKQSHKPLSVCSFYFLPKTALS